MKAKSKLLILSRSVPVYDRNSVFLRLFHMLEYLAQHFEITYLAIKDHHYYGFTEDIYSKKLKELKIKYYIENFNIDEILKENFQFILVQFYYVAKNFIYKLFNAPNKPYLVIDTGDIHYHRIKMKYEISKSKADYQEYLLTRKIELFIYRFFDLIITVTENDKKILQKDLPSGKIRVIPDVYDQIKIKEKLNKRNIILFIGQYRHHPNEDAVIYFSEKIFPLVLKKTDNVEFWIAGDGITQDIKRLESKNIKILGFVKNAAQTVSKAKISVVPLRYGAGIKGKVIESLACGVPVVTTPVGVEGMPVKHNKDVLIGETPEEFANCIIRITQDRTLEKKLIKNGLKIFNKYYSKKVMNQLLKRIFEVLSKRRLSSYGFLRQAQDRLTTGSGSSFHCPSNITKANVNLPSVRFNSIQEMHAFTEIYLKNGLIENAKKLLKQILRKDPSNSLGLYRLASLEKNIMNFKYAEQLFQKLLKSSDEKNKGGIYFHLGEINLIKGDRKKAGKKFNEVLKYIPLHKKALQYLKELQETCHSGE